MRDEGPMKRAPRPSSIQPEWFYRDLTLVSYIVHKVAELDPKRKMDKTRLTKIAANLIVDWKKILQEPGHYRIKLKNKPNPFGKVAYVPYLHNQPPIYKLEPSASRVGMWEIQKDDDESVVLLSSSAELGELLTTEAYGFQPLQLIQVDILSKLYCNLDTVQLNILVSHRDASSSEDCLEWVYRRWETNYQEILPILKAPGRPGDFEKARDNALRMAICSGQIELKLRYVLSGIADVADRLQNIREETMTDRYEREVVNAIISKIGEETAYSTGRKAAFYEYYSTNREYIYPITNAVATAFRKKTGESLDFEGDLLEMRKLLIRGAPVFKRRSSPQEIDMEKGLPQLLEEIEKVHAKAKQQAGFLLRPFAKQHGPYEAKEDWVIRDGRGG